MGMYNHRHVCLHACMTRRMCACLHVHTLLYVGVYVLTFMQVEFTCELVSSCIHVGLVYRSGIIFLHAYMCAEFTCFGVHIYKYCPRVYLWSCICLHICPPSLQVVYLFTYMQAECTCVCVYINIYTHETYMFEVLYLHISTPSLQMWLRRVYMGVCMY